MILAHVGVGKNTKNVMEKMIKKTGYKYRAL